MAVLKEDDNMIVGHVPRNLSPSLRLFQFLRRDVNKAFAEVTGQKVNRGAGYGLEIPCTYRLYDPPAYVNRMFNHSLHTARVAGHIYVTVRYLGGRGAGLTRGWGFDRWWEAKVNTKVRLGMCSKVVGRSREVAAYRGFL